MEITEWRKILLRHELYEHNFNVMMVLQRILMEEADQLQRITAFVNKTNPPIHLYRIKLEKNGAEKGN